VLDASSLEDAFAGARFVFHVAGLVAACRRDASAVLRTNVIGTRNAVLAAGRAGVERLVLTSSAATIGERAREIGREDTRHRGWFLSAYERSKAEAESEAFALARTGRPEVVGVNPASVQGPGRADGTARLLLLAARGRLPVTLETTVSFVDVGDCAAGHRLAAERGAPGERYLLCGATMSTDETLRIVDAVVGRRVGGRPGRRVRVPTGAALPAAALVETGFSILRRDPPICRELALALMHGRRYDGSRAARELGLEYRAPDETIARTIAWFRTSGLLPN